jgi:hypothetical protein
MRNPRISEFLIPQKIRLANSPKQRKKGTLLVFISKDKKKTSRRLDDVKIYEEKGK